MIEMYPIPAGIPGNLDRDRPIIIIDIFRASTSITAALASGASEVFIAGSRAEADILKKHLGERAILAGERGGFKIEGYDLGNSPLEMTPAKVKGRPVIFNSTNGTRLMRRFQDFRNVLVGSVVSLTATVTYLSKLTGEPVFCCAADEGRFSTEDTIAAGLMLQALSYSESDLDDAAAFAVRLVKSAGENWYDWSKNSVHGQLLAAIGMGDDLDACLDRDRYDFLAIKDGDRIIRSDLKPL